MMYTIRNASEKTKETLNKFAQENNLTIAQALTLLLELGFEAYEQQKKGEKKYKNTLEAIKNLPEW